mmetsp:Transcript_3265/g.8012  ORF Transcript_3265/g.8012 Transcript_3265/m.8012 type:complete len:735 (+) Transcript_3265:33-2237(+)|eukprot:CAMPEP_0182917242 /NCGR_PEP_ID=MMETSP0105_2-20130417/1404_1 /TAXON_ID=81532 ORGANISM="Acanthoeca-like sp., Strain 10tr" /NCGR_SAMPLE_ID=MMETSP0105_2 /ASSEMBLY_ACC=CAM_ASM_000205 /LENGTH=734 /DNA_ID=CAMNT_0025054235 /DNA_START=33 /DNA_END=2237 /DNA_ORIENTATION=+
MALLMTARRLGALAVTGPARWMSASPTSSRLRNIGISAHIDSGKTTLTERVLFYTGRIKAIHEVRGKDEVGAKMDSMELEREKGITIASAATYTSWGGQNVNIIDTPGHVDFTVEVERALRVLDGAVLVLCSVGGVQSQTLTVDRQMRRYDVPRIAFINKCDRPGANPDKVVGDIRSKLRANAAFIQIPIGVEDQLDGVVDLVKMVAYRYRGPKGETVETEEIPADMLELAEERRTQLIEAVADIDEEIGDLYLEEIEPTEEQLVAAIRRQTIGLKLVPVCVGSALKNTGVQSMLDAVVDYLPSPGEVQNVALDADDESVVPLDSTDPKAPFVGMAFKIEKGQFGQLTYCRTYQGTLKKGSFIHNVSADRKKRVKVPRLVRMHSDEMEDVDEVGPGEICALFGLECSSGDTFTDGSMAVVLESMFVPEPVMSLSIKPKKSTDLDTLGKALNRFTKQDPTFRVHVDPETSETIISGMGELHLEIYKERLLREYKCDTETGHPKVSYRETITAPTSFDYIHKKQTGGSGQYGRVMGSIEPISADEDDDSEGDPKDDGQTCEFVDETVGNNISKSYVPAIQKGFFEACVKGPLTGSPVERVRFTLKDGAQHAVDSSEMAFKAAGLGAMRETVRKAEPQVLQPIMKVEISVPEEYQGTVMGGINKKGGTVVDSETQEGYCTLVTQVPLGEMFGYSSELRQATQGKGEFTMEFDNYSPVNPGQQMQLIEAYQAERTKKK